MDKTTIQHPESVAVSQIPVERANVPSVSPTRSLLRERAELRTPMVGEPGGDEFTVGANLGALAATKLVKTFGDDVEAELHHRMIKAYFYENRTISDANVIAAIAGEAGLDTTDFAARSHRRSQ